eukprot:gene17346-35774_t
MNRVAVSSDRHPGSEWVVKERSDLSGSSGPLHTSGADFASVSASRDERRI